MINDKAISEKELSFEGWEAQSLVVALKSLDGKMFVDARKWIKSGDRYIPTKRGITLEVEHWKQTMTAIQGLLQ